MGTSARNQAMLHLLVCSPPRGNIAPSHCIMKFMFHFISRMKSFLTKLASLIIQRKTNQQMSFSHLHCSELAPVGAPTGTLSGWWKDPETKASMWGQGNAEVQDEEH